MNLGRLSRSRRPPWRPLVSVMLLLTLLTSSTTSATLATTSVDPAKTLECHRREFTYKVVRDDSLGRKCWDFVTAMSCWGRCDSFEISDWQFPYKMPHHPVCMHASKQLRSVQLRNCEDDVEPGTELYEYYDATACHCKVCQSSKANCEWLHLRSTSSSSA